MNKGGGAKGGEHGIFKTKRYSLLLDGLFNDSKYMSLKLDSLPPLCRQEH